MTYSNFIGTDYIFKNSFIDDNVDPSLLEPFIRMASDLHIQQILGNTLYVKIMNDIATTGTTTGYYKELLDTWISPSLMYWAIYESIPFINYRFTNKAISEKTTTGNTGGSNPADISTVKYLRDIVRDKAEFYNQRIREYIINNEQHLPEYTIYTNLQSIKPKNTTYFGGIYLRNGYVGGINNLPGSGFPLN